jgi:hypothetical protein
MSSSTAQGLQLLTSSFTVSGSDMCGIILLVFAHLAITAGQDDLMQLAMISLFQQTYLRLRVHSCISNNLKGQTKQIQVSLVL